MEIINVSRLRRLGSGDECDVYQFARMQVIKCFREDSYVREDGSHPNDVYKAQKFLASLGLAPPVFKFVQWKKGKATGYAYICGKASRPSGDDVFELDKIIKEKLKIELVDLHEKNIGRYAKRPVVIDCGYDALRILKAAEENA